MKQIYILLFLLNTPLVLWAQLSLKTDRLSRTYELGEVVQYIVSSTQAQEVAYQIRTDKQSAPIQEGILSLVEGTNAKIAFEPLEAGIYICVLSTVEEELKVGVAVDPLNIEPYEPKPIDFDVFWENAIDELSTIAIDPVLTFYQTNTNSTSYKLRIATIENRSVYGYLTVPNGSGPFPALVSLPPFGNDGALILPEVFVAEQAKALTLAISIHNVPVDEEDPNAYQPNELLEVENYYYKKAVIATIRAIDYLFSRSDFNGNDLIIEGVSQGGGLAALVAGLDTRVKALASSNTALCQHMGVKYNKASGFPYYVATVRGAMPGIENELSTTRSVKYVDAIYTMQNYKGSALFTTDLVDEICPAATVFAAYNQLHESKIMVMVLDKGHSSPDDYWTGRLPFFRQYVESMSNPNLPWLSTTSYYANADAHKVILSNMSVSLTGEVGYDKTANTQWPVKWTLVEGAGAVRMSNPNSRQNTIAFYEKGTYLLKLTAYDDQFLVSDKKRIIVEDYVTIDIE